MIIKIAGKPLDMAFDIKDIDLGIVKDAYHMIHTPINLDMTYGSRHLINGDINIFNIPKYIYLNVSHHIGDLF